MRLESKIFREEDSLRGHLVHIVGSNLGLVDPIPEEQHPASIDKGNTIK